MSIIRFRSPVTKPLLRAGTPKPAPPDPRAYDTFRVTQQFGTPDSFYAELDIREGRTPRTHGATDVGNYRCGEPVVAMAAGTVRRVRDNATALGAPSDALGVVIDHGGGITSEYWHLDRYAGPSSGPVAQGQQIGVVGRTGLGNVCHLHVEVKRNGVKLDPEPLMFGGSLTVEDDMQLPSGAGYLASGVIGPGNRLRISHDTTDGSEVLKDVTAVDILGIVYDATDYTLPDGRKGNRWYIVRRADTGDVRQVAHLLVTGIEPTPWLFSQVPLPAADCSAQETTIAQLKTKISRAATSAAGAAQAANATVAALR